MRTGTALLAILLVAPWCGGQVLFEDDFSDGDYEGWYTNLFDAGYEVNGAYRFELSYSGNDQYAMPCRGDLGQVMSQRDYSVVAEVIGHDPTSHVGLEVRFDPESFTGYVFYLNLLAGTYYVLRCDTLAQWESVCPSTPYPGGFDYGTSYWMRLECKQDTLRAKVWEGGPALEPSEWMLEGCDETYYTYGTVCLEVFNKLGDDFDAEFDNIDVTAPSLGLEPGTWARIKASSAE